MARTNKPEKSEEAAKGHEAAVDNPHDEDWVSDADSNPLRKQSGQGRDDSEPCPDGDNIAGDGGAGAAAGSAQADEEPADSGSDPIAEMQGELTAERDKYLRLAAEYDNFRKRSAKERDMIYSNARADTITRILPVYDNLERALRAECADEAFYKGVEMMMTQLTEILEGMGAVPIPAVGEPFDPNRHNAVTTIEDPSFGDKIVAEEYQKGFMLGERVIRFSTVVVAN